MLKLPAFNFASPMFLLLRHVLIKVCCKIELSSNVLYDPSGFHICNAVIKCIHLTRTNIFFFLTENITMC